MSSQQSDCKYGSSIETVRVVLASAHIGDSAATIAQVPERVLIVPWGDIQSDAGSFVLDDAAADETLAAFTAHGTDLPIDYEHQTLGGAFSSPDGLAPAAGWINGLTKVSPADAGRDHHPAEPGLWAHVAWTGDGAQRLAHREYRYLSPVALVRKGDGRLVGVHSVALTNKPAIAGMKAVVNRAPATSEPGAADTHLAALKIALSLDANAADEIVLRTAVGRIREMQHANAHRAAADRVALAMSAGKLSPSQKEWAHALAVRDPAEFDRWQAQAPLVVAAGRTQPPGRSSLPSSESSRKCAESMAREEWRTHRNFLEKLCTEDAYVANALRGMN